MAARKVPAPWRGAESGGGEALYILCTLWKGGKVEETLAGIFTKACTH